MESQPGPRQIFRLEKESELRCEASWETPVSIRLVTGTAEIFGTEIAQGQWLAFRGGEKFAVFTWHGAEVEVEGTPEVIYTADETPMVQYVNVHAVLSARRAEAQAAAAPSADAEGPPQGPRVMLVGPTDSGKSSLARILVSYAARQGFKPTYVDLDLGQGALGMPGTVGAAPIEAPPDPTAGIPLDAPLLYFYGHVTPSANADLYKLLVRQLAGMLERQFSTNSEAAAAGLVINTMGWVEGLGYELLLDSINALQVNVVLVLGQERLCSMLENVFRDRGASMDIVKLPRSGGVVARTSKFRQLARQQRTREYFYGLTAELAPHAAVASFEEVSVFRVGGGPQAPRSALPIGAEPSANPNRVVAVSVSPDLLHSVLAVSHAKDPDQLLSSNVAGFIYITDINMSRKKITYVAPSPGPLPGPYLIAGSLALVE